MTPPLPVLIGNVLKRFLNIFWSSTVIILLDVTAETNLVVRILLADYVRSKQLTQHLTICFRDFVPCTTVPSLHSICERVLTFVIQILKSLPCFPVNTATIWFINVTFETHIILNLCEFFVITAEVNSTIPDVVRHSLYEVHDFWFNLGLSACTV